MSIIENSQKFGNTAIIGSKHIAKKQNKINKALKLHLHLILDMKIHLISTTY